MFKLKGDWVVEIAGRARVKRICQDLEAILQYLEGRGVLRLEVDYRLRRADAALHGGLESLGIGHVFCLRPDGSGKVHFTMPGPGGMVDECGSKVPVWLGEFLRDPAHADVISKLQRSRAETNEVFVIATLGGTPWAVESYLTGDLDSLPPESPDLPDPITGAWVVHTHGSKGLYWSGIVWIAVQARGEGIEGPPPNKPVQSDSFSAAADRLGRPGRYRI